MNQNQSFLQTCRSFGILLKTSSISYCWFCRKERVGLAVLQRSQRRVQRRLKPRARRARRARHPRHPKVLKVLHREKDLVMGYPNFGPKDVSRALKLKQQKVGASSRWANGPLICLTMSSRRAHEKACASQVVAFWMHFQQWLYAGCIRIQKHVCL